MEISKDLRTLSFEFKKLNYELYIVGGYVRDSLLGLQSKDIDLSSSAPYEIVSQICKDLKFKCIPVNKKLGTLKIVANNQEYEYTQFRKESYSNNTHTPDEIVFVEDLSTDAMRRDITINSLYYEISTNRIIDIVHGQKDLENKIIRTTNTPHITLHDDGLRILRIIRFASLLNFQIEKNTFKALKFNTFRLKNISKERILKELESIVIADTIHNNSNYLALHYFNKLKIYEYLFNSRYAKIKLRKSDIKKFYKLNPISRKMGLYMLIMKNQHGKYTAANQLKFDCNLLLGNDGIKDSNLNISTLEKIYLIYQNLEYNVDLINATINYLTLSNTEKEIIDILLSKNSKNTLSDNISFIKSKKLPLGLHNLAITAQDLIDNNINNKYISKILMTLFNQVIEMKVANEKDDLIDLAKNINDTFISITNQIEGEKNENNILPPRRESCQSKKTKKPRR